MKTFKIVTILSLVLLSSLVSAHSGLKNSTPENGAMLNKLPEKVMLEYSSKVKLIKLQLMGQSGQIKLINTPSKNFETTFNIVLPVLDTGSYKVKWVAMGKDAHKMKGEFTFMLHASDMEKMPASTDSNKKL
jgi:methionine-rich copper-binding protein CopC